MFRYGDLRMVRRQTHQFSTQARSIGKSLEELRERAGLNETQWLRVLRCTRAEYSSYQSGKRMPLITVVAHAALFSGLTLTAVFSGKLPKGRGIRKRHAA